MKFNLDIRNDKRLYLILFLVFLLLLSLSGVFEKGNKGPGPGQNSAFPKTLNNYNLSEETISFSGKVRMGDNIVSILSREGIERSSIFNILEESRDKYDLKKIRAGNKYTLTYNSNGLKKFRYDIDVNKYLKVIKNGSGRYGGKLVEIPYSVRPLIVKGVINGSLYETILKIKERPGLADTLASLYEYDIDFNRDIRSGDTFLIFVEKKYLDGKFAGYGKVLGAEFTNRGKTTRVVRFTGKNGKSSYYHPDGKAVKKMFLRCPLPFMRVTSRFGFRRHPVLGFSSSHTGVDFGAPTGTIVRSTADGRVFSIGYNRIKGRFIVISHGNKYKTHYYHLSGIRKGIRRGKHVSQGNIIGYVGNTGRSTGPHLHYGLQRGRSFINPFRLKSPSKDPVKKSDMDKFKITTAALFLLMELDKNYKLPERLNMHIRNFTINTFVPGI